MKPFKYCLGAAIATSLASAASPQASSPEAERAQHTESDVSFYEDADSAANDYLRENPNSFAVAIRLGGATQVPPSRIKSVLDDDFRANGVSNAIFFFEHGRSDLGSSAVFATNTQVHGPYGLAQARKAVPEAAKQYRFDLALSDNNPE